MAFAYSGIACDIPLISITINRIVRVAGVDHVLNQI